MSISSIKQRLSTFRVPRLVSRVIVVATIGAGLTACVVQEPNYRANRHYGSHITVVEKQPRSGYRHRQVRQRPVATPRSRHNVRRAAPRPHPRARPAARPTRPYARPTRPHARPAARPTRRDTRPAVRPTRPHTRPAARPTRPHARPAARPTRPQARPDTRSKARPVPVSRRTDEARRKLREAQRMR